MKNLLSQKVIYTRHPLRQESSFIDFYWKLLQAYSIYSTKALLKEKNKLLNTIN